MHARWARWLGLNLIGYQVIDPARLSLKYFCSMYECRTFKDHRTGSIDLQVR